MRPAAAGSAAMPRVTTRARLATAVSSCAPDRVRGTSAGVGGVGRTPRRVASATEASRARRAATAALIERSSRGRNATSAPEHEHRHGDAHRARRGEQADEQPEVDDGDPPQRATVEPRRGRSHHGRAPTEHRGDEVGQRAEEQLRGEADHDDRGDGPVAVGQRGPRRAGRQSPPDERRVRRPHQPSAALTDQVAKTFGGACRAGPTRARPHQASPAAYPTRPARAAGREPRAAPVARTAMAVTSTGRACRARRSARSSMRVRSIVGHRVTSVPVTVSPIQPSTITIEWATSTAPCRSSSRPRASQAPRVAPTGTHAAAAR